MSNVCVFRGKTILSEQCGEMSFIFDPICIDLDHRGHNCQCNQHRHHHQCSCNHDQDRHHHQCNCNHDHRDHHHSHHDHHHHHHNHHHHNHHCPNCQQNQQSQGQENVSREENAPGTSEMQVNWDTHLQVDPNQVNNAPSQSPSYQTTAGQSGQKDNPDYRQKPCGCNK
jgi:hypothetical protein